MLSGCYFFSSQTSKDSSEINALHQQGESFSKEELYDHAIMIYEKILSMDSNDFLAYYKLGNILFHQNKLSDSLEMFKKTYSINPDYCKTYYNIAAIYSNSDNGTFFNEEKADIFFHKFLTCQPNSDKKERIFRWLKNYQNRKKNTLKNNNEISLDEEKYKRALKKNPDNFEAHYQLGLIYFKKEKWIESRNELIRCISINPSHKEALYSLGVVYSKDGETYNREKAKFFFRKYLELAPNSSRKKRIESFF